MIVTEFQHEPLFNQIRWVRDPRGFETSYEYDDAFPNSFFRKVSGENGRPLVAHLPDATPPEGAPLTGLTLRYGYDPKTGVVKSATDTGGHTTTYQYQEGTGYLTAVLPPTGRGLRYEPGPRGNVLRETAQSGTVTRYVVSRRNLLEKRIRDENGFAHETIYEHDRNGNLVRRSVDWRDDFADAGGGKSPTPKRRRRVTQRMEYDLLNRLTRVTEDADGELKLASDFEHDRNGNVVEVRSPSPDGEGQVTTRYEYEGRGLVSKVIHAAGTPAQAVIQHAYDEHGNLEVATDPRCGAVTAHAARAAGSTDACPITRYHYDGFDRLNAIEDAMGGVVASVSIDPAGNVEEATFTGDTGDGGRKLLSRTERVFDEYNRLVERRQHVLQVVDERTGAIEDAEDAVLETRWFYDRDARLARIEGPGAATSTYTYDVLHRIDVAEDAAGNRTDHGYDDEGRLASITQRDVTPALDHPQLGSLAAGARELVTRWTWDALGRPLSREDSGGHVRRLFHDSLGSVRGELSEEGQLTQLEYDAAGRLVSVRSPIQRVDYAYFPAGTQKRVRSAGVERSFEYDALGRVKRARQAGAETRFDRDAAGNPITTTDPNGTVAKRTFDRLGRPVAVEVAWGEVETSSRRPIDHLDGPTRESFRWDGLGRLAVASNGATEVRRRYDGLDRLIQEHQTLRNPTGLAVRDEQVVATHYGDGLSRQVVRYPAAAEGIHARAELDPLGRATRLTAGSDALADYRYEGTGRVAWRRAGNGVESFRQYDEDRRNWRTLVQDPAGTRLARQTLAFDVHSPSRVAEQVRVGNGERHRIVEHRLDALRRPVVTRTYGFTELDTAPETGVAERARELLTGVKAGSFAQVDQNLSESLRGYDGEGRVARVAEASYDEVQDVFAEVRSDVLAYDAEGRVGSTTTRLSRGVSGGPGALLGLLESAKAVAKAQVIGMRRAALDDPPAGSPFAGDSRIFDASVSDALGRVDGILAEPTLPPETQSFRYDANGNLVEDGRYLYVWDHENRLVRIQDTFERSGAAFGVTFTYDPLGRRVLQDYEPDVDHSALPDLRFLYERDRPIAEVALSGDGRTAGLAARYFYGAGARELVRVDRRPGERLGEDLARYFVHDGFQEELTFVTQESRAARRVTPRSVGVVRDEPRIEGERVIAPDPDAPPVEQSLRFAHAAGGTLREPLSGIACQAPTGECLFDHRSAPLTSDRLQRAEFRDALLERTSVLHRQLLTVMAAQVAPVVAAELGATAIGQQVLVGGGVSVGVDYGMTKLMGGDYAIEQGLAAFGLGGLSGGFGSSMAATFGTRAAARLGGAAAVAVDTASGAAADMLLYGNSLQDALVTNLVFNAASTGAAAGWGSLTPAGTPDGAASAGRVRRNRAPPRERAAPSRALEVEPFETQVGLPAGPLSITAKAAHLNQVRIDFEIETLDAPLPDVRGYIVKPTRYSHAGLSSLTDVWQLFQRDMLGVRGYTDIVVHGSPGHFGQDIPAKLPGEYKPAPLTAGGLAVIMRAKGFEVKPGAFVRLISCEAGALPNGVARELAEILGVSVVAASTTVFISRTGQFSAFDYLDNFGRKVLPPHLESFLGVHAALGTRPPIRQGQWRLFVPGETGYHVVPETSVAHGPGFHATALER